MTFPTTTPPAPPLQAEITLTDVTAGTTLTPGFASNEDGRYEAAAGGSVINSGDRITCQIQQVTDLEHGGSTVSGAGPVVSQGPIPANYGIGNGNTPW